MLNRKGVASLATFSFILMLLILIFILSYNYYKDSKFDSDLNLKELEVLNALGSFRSQLVDITSYSNSSLNYSNVYEGDDLSIYLNSKIISGNLIYSGRLIEINISTLGPSFCSNYSFYPAFNTEFYFNGSCISVTS